MMRTNVPRLIKAFPSQACDLIKCGIEASARVMVKLGR